MIHLIHKIELLTENHMVQFPDRETVACNDQDEMPSWGKPCITCSKACKLWTLNFLYFRNNSCNRNSLSKYLLKDRGNMLKFWVVNKDILTMLFVLFWPSLLLTVGNVTICFDVSVIGLEQVVPWWAINCQFVT